MINPLGLPGRRELSPELELNKIQESYDTAKQTRIEFIAFKNALTEGFTENQFSEDFENLDDLIVSNGYYDESLKRLSI